MPGKGLLEQLAEGPVICDGGFTFGLEKRGYVRGGAWTPECTVLHKDAVKQYHREFLRSGADVMQAFNFYSTEDKIEFAVSDLAKKPTSEEINRSACKIAREVADEGEAIISASMSETPSYREGKGKQVVVEQFQKQIEFLKTCDIDFIICEYFSHIEEMEWAIEEAKKLNKPVAASMCIGPHTDKMGVSTGECAVRMVKAGADVVGINCNFGPKVVLKGMRVMKKALDEAGLSPYLMCQPLGYFTPEVETGEGYLDLPEAPFALDSRLITRFEAMKYAREAYEIGVRFIGGCCGFEPFHIRGMAEELQKERCKVAQVTKEMGSIVDGLKKNIRSHIVERGTVEYWKALEPATGRPNSAAYSKQMTSNAK